MKARKVKGLDPEGPLEGNLRRIVAVRVDELRSFGPSALDPEATEAHHDMRIAAKRLRYVLELGEPVLGKPARQGAKDARTLQDLLGEMHDCDVGVPRVLDAIAKLRDDDLTAVRNAADPKASDLEPSSVRVARNRRRYPGLESMVTFLRARREVLYAEFLRTWTRMERAGFGDRLNGKRA
jgi:CHAD domain-containing protein